MNLGTRHGWISKTFPVQVLRPEHDVQHPYK